MREFDLATILSVITGINLEEDFNKVFELAKYIYNDEFINDSAISYLRNDMKDYLISLYPELGELGYIPQSIIYLELWIDMQKEKFGESLSIIPKEKSLKKNKTR